MVRLFEVVSRAIGIEDALHGKLAVVLLSSVDLTHALGHELVVLEAGSLLRHVSAGPNGSSTLQFGFSFTRQIGPESERRL
jgi:hypothetical protein